MNVVFSLFDKHIKYEDATQDVFGTRQLGFEVYRRS
jgi:hypothetical protein